MLKLFRKGLSLELQAELACRDNGRTLNEFIELAIHIDNLLRPRRPVRLSTLTNPSSEPMQLGYTPLHPEERERRRQLHLCLYCGQAGHFKIKCPIRPNPSNPKAVSSPLSTEYSSNCLKIPIQVTVNNQRISTHALLDSGAAGNFMSDTFIKEHNITLTDCSSPLTVEALDGRPIGGGRVAHITTELSLQIGVLRHEHIRFYVIHSTIQSSVVSHGSELTTRIFLGRRARSFNGMPPVMNAA